MKFGADMDSIFLLLLENYVRVSELWECLSKTKMWLLVLVSFFFFLTKYTYADFKQSWNLVRTSILILSCFSVDEASLITVKCSPKAAPSFCVLELVLGVTEWQPSALKESTLFCAPSRKDQNDKFRVRNLKIKPFDFTLNSCVYANCPQLSVATMLETKTKKQWHRFCTCLRFWCLNRSSIWNWKP